MKVVLLCGLLLSIIAHETRPDSKVITLYEKDFDGISPGLSQIIYIYS